MANATTPVIQINEGNVGIGTISPSDKLQLKGDATYISVIASDGSNGAKLGADSSGDGLLQLYSDAGVNNIKLYGEAASPSYINAGNVGIGTTNPTNTDFGSLAPKLHVKQSDTSGAFNLVARFQAGSDANDTGGAILINHSNDRGLLIEGGRGGGEAIPDDDAVSHLGLVQSNGTKYKSNNP